MHRIGLREFEIDNETTQLTESSISESDFAKLIGAHQTDCAIWKVSEKKLDKLVKKGEEIDFSDESLNRLIVITDCNEYSFILNEKSRKFALRRVPETN